MISMLRRQSLTRSAKRADFQGRPWSSSCTHTWIKGMASKTSSLNGLPPSSQESSNIKKKITTWHYSAKYFAPSAMKNSDSSSKRSKRQSLLSCGPCSAKSTLRRQKILSLAWWTQSYQAKDLSRIGNGGESSRKCTMRKTIAFSNLNWTRNWWLNRQIASKVRWEQKVR